MPRTPLHTRYATVSRYHEIATDLLASLTADAETMMASNHDEYHAELTQPEREMALASRLDAESWTEETTQQLRDALYLLAVGDHGPTAVAANDPDGAIKQAHHQRHRAAHTRLTEAGLL